MMRWLDRHRRLRDQLSAYIDGALEPPAAARLEDHLAQCERCRAELEQLRATVAALGQLPEAQVPRSFALSPERAAAPRPALATTRLAFGARIAAAGVAVALAAVLVVDLGSLGGGGVSEETTPPGMTAERQAYGGEMEEDVGGAPLEPLGTPVPPGAEAEEAPDEMMGLAGGAETPAAGPEEVEAPAPAPEGGGIDALTAAEIGLAAALGVLVVGSLALAMAGRKR